MVERALGGTMRDWTTAKFADGPAVVEWLERRGIKPRTDGQVRRMSDWKRGGAADFFTLDRILTPTNYGAWDLPDEVWLDAENTRQIQLGPDWRPKPAPKPRQL